MERYIELSQAYPTFIYHDYSYRILDHKLEGAFTYQILDGSGTCAFEFCTSYTIDLPGSEAIAEEKELDALAYNLGLAEAISYWKLTCAPTIEIKCGALDDYQVEWWRKLFKKGLSEFFYLNDILDWDSSTLQFVSKGKHKDKTPSAGSNNEKVILPIGGGKDSITSYHILKADTDIVPLVMNPIKASLAFMEAEVLHDYIKVSRRLDKQIIELNANGFLNGHIPFSAVLSMYAMMAARLYGFRQIALSNESSANEPTILGTDINHQYSKSLEYEQDITDYRTKYLDPEINYFSLLRPLNEYQITKIFSTSDENILKLFRSCNKGSKQGIWCCKCPKCLFTYIMVHAHLSREKMLDIFGADLLEDEDMKGYFLSLTGQRTEKPFECVGTVEEVNAALQVIKDKRETTPLLIDRYWSEDLVEKSAVELLEEFLTHRLDEKYESLVRKKLADARQV